MRRDSSIESVRQRYAALATTAAQGASCCTPDEQAVFGASRYADDDLDAIPETATAASLGCGNPTAVADLAEGDIVLDLGSGGGIDVILSARRVGMTGKAYGLDMTDEMLDLARRNATEAGVTNVEFLEGLIERIPLPDAHVDVVISNCVINLSSDKDAVIAEAARVLRPGGVRGQRRHRRPRHGRRHPRGGGAVDRLRRRRAHPRRLHPAAPSRRPHRYRDHRIPSGARPRQLGDHPRP